MSCLFVTAIIKLALVKFVVIILLLFVIQPNCVAEIVSIEKDKKIIIISSRRIEKGEEVFLLIFWYRKRYCYYSFGAVIILSVPLLFFRYRITR